MMASPVLVGGAPERVEVGVIEHAPDPARERADHGAGTSGLRLPVLLVERGADTGPVAPLVLRAAGLLLVPVPVQELEGAALGAAERSPRRARQVLPRGWPWAGQPQNVAPAAATVQRRPGAPRPRVSRSAAPAGLRQDARVTGSPAPAARRPPAGPASGRRPACPLR